MAWIVVHYPKAEKTSHLHHLEEEHKMALQLEVGNMWQLCYEQNTCKFHQTVVFFNQKRLPRQENRFRLKADHE